MKYFILRQNTDPKIIGLRSHPVQGEIYKNGFTNKANYDQYYNFFHGSDWANHLGTFPEFSVNLECIKIKSGAKMLDFMTYSPILDCGDFLISRNAQKLLTSFNLPPYKFFNTNLYHKNEVYDDYKVFYNPFLDYSVLDFEKSLFFEGTRLNRGKELRIKRLEDYKNFNGIKNVDTIVLNERFDKNLDLFQLRISADYFISERLKEAIEKGGLTGLNIIEANNPKIIYINK